MLTHRNHLLRRIREDRSASDELGFWDDQLCGDAGNLIVQRRDTLLQLAGSISGIYWELGIVSYIPFKSIGFDNFRIDVIVEIFKFSIGFNIIV